MMTKEEKLSSAVMLFFHVMKYTKKNHLTKLSIDLNLEQWSSSLGARAGDRSIIPLGLQLRVPSWLRPKF